MTVGGAYNVIFYVTRRKGCVGFKAEKPRPAATFTLNCISTDDNVAVIMAHYVCCNYVGYFLGIHFGILEFWMRANFLN